MNLRIIPPAISQFIFFFHENVFKENHKLLNRGKEISSIRPVINHKEIDEATIIT